MAEISGFLNRKLLTHWQISRGLAASTSASLLPGAVWVGRALSPNPQNWGFGLPFSGLRFTKRFLFRTVLRLRIF